MKILFLTPGCFDKGGISRYNRYQIKSLMEIYGAEKVRVLSLFGPGADNLKDEFKVHWHGRANDIFSKIGFLFTGFIQSLFWRPDFIFIAHVNFSGFAWMYSKICGAKTVLNIYGLEIWGHLSGDAKMGFKKVDEVIADCHYTAHYAEDHGWRKKETIKVIWDCVDLQQFRSRPDQWNLIQKKYSLPDRDQHFIILSLGRLSRDAAYKGYERLLEVFSIVNKKHPSAKLIYAGKGDMIPALKEQAIKLNVGDSVFFTGSIPEEEMAGLYSYSHLFSLISHRDQDSGEGIPLTPLEAMACGAPVLVGNQDGSQEAVFENRNGFVLDPFDLTSHESSINAFIENERLQKSMAIEARRVAEQYFSYQEFKEKHRVLMLSIQDKN